MKDFIDWLGFNKVKVGIGYVVYMLLFYFIGIPKQSFGAFVVSFLVVTLFFFVVLFAIKKLWIDKQ